MKTKQPILFNRQPKNGWAQWSFNHLKPVIFSFLFLTILCNGYSQDYPFKDLPSTVKATLDVEVAKTEKFKNTIMGYNVEGFNTSTQKEFIKKIDPITIRFPHGVWANFYKWQTDGYQQDSYDNTSHQSVLNTYVSKIKGHIGGIQDLNNQKKQSNGGIGYDMMWTYSVNFDDAASSVARAKNDISLGLQVKDIELGNEHFWKNQRANRTATPEMYVTHAKSIASALKNEFPDLRVSIPLSWRRNHAGYNKTLADNKTYFDAITIHKYLGADPDKPGESDKAYGSLLSSRLTLEEDVNWVRDNYGPGKPIWLTEWGVSAGSNVHGAACLGMADAYLFMSENQHIYDRANWFSFNRILNAMVVVGSNREPVYPLQKRGYLSTYEVLHDVLKDATMLESKVSGTKINTDKGPMSAVSARIVTKNGITSVIAVNLTDKPAEFEIKLDGTIYTSSFKHEALVFENLGVVNSVGFDSNPLKVIKEGTGKIILPPLSISKISGITLTTVPNQNPVVSFKTPTNNAQFKTTDKIEVEVNATDANGIANVKLYLNSTLVRQENKFPYQWGLSSQNDAQLQNLAAGTYTLRTVATDNTGKTMEKSISITVNADAPKDCAGVSGGSASVDACGVCSGGTTGITPSSPKTWYADADGDGSGDANNSVEDCNKPSGYVAVAGDECPNDGNKTNPGECGCGVEEGTCSENQAPILSFTKPLNGDSYVEGITLVGNVIATDADGSISNVVLYVNGTLVRQENFSPYDWNHKDQDAALQNMTAGTYVLRAIATDNKGLSSETSITITLKEEEVVTSDAIIGDDCSVKNGAASFEFNSAMRENVTGYSWWFSGSSSSVISPNAAPYTAEITMSQYYKGGEVCVGVNSNAAPYYKSYCKSVGVCSDQELLEATEVLVTEYPNPVDGNSITIEINEQSGEILEVSILSSTGDTQMSTTEFVSGGQLNLSSLPSGSHILRVVTEYGVVNKRILKL